MVPPSQAASVSLPPVPMAFHVPSPAPTSVGAPMAALQHAALSPPPAGPSRVPIGAPWMAAQASYAPQPQVRSAPGVHGIG